MSSIARPHPVRILAALVVLSLPTGWPAHGGVPGWLAVPGAMLLLVLPLWNALVRTRDDGDQLPAIARTAVVLLAALGTCAVAGIDVIATGWVLAAAVAIVLLVSGRPAHVARPSWWTVAAMVSVVVIVASRPLPLLLSSDAPAHVAAILDASDAGTLLPPDNFPGSTGSDPRFGILHGFFAIISGWTGATAGEVLRWAALVFSPLWLLAHATLIRRLGPGQRIALLVALLFTLQAGAGRAFGLGAAAFPGSVAQTLCALGLAELIRGRGRALAVALIALSALVHPFAWWATTIVIALAGALMLRDGWRTWFAHAAIVLVAGLLVLVPRLATRGEAQGLHSQLMEVVFVGGGLFVADPLWIFRWGGTGSVLALPALLLVMLLSRRWIHRREHRVGLALTLPVWLISLNPLVAPIAWSAVSYLVVRLGRIVITTWVWASMLGAGIERARSGGRGLLAAIVLGGLGIAGLVQEAGSAWLHLREPQVADAPSTDGHLAELSSALSAVPAPRLLTDPRIGYGLRAQGGPPLVLTPVAHASPNDRYVLDRLACWRELFDPTLDDDELGSRLGAFGDVAFLIDERTVELHAGVREYAYVPDDARARALSARLRGLGLPVLAQGEGWTVFELQGNPATPRDLGDADPFSIVDARLDRIEAGTGETLRLEIELQATGQDSATPRRIFVRLEGDMPEVPGAVQGISKLWRKLFVERSGRSQERFGQWVVPAGLVIPVERWDGGRFTEVVDLRIPEWAEPGTYTVQLTVHEWTWHESYDLRDYLSDTDRYSAAPAAIVQIDR